MCVCVTGYACMWAVRGLEVPFHTATARAYSANGRDGMSVQLVAVALRGKGRVGAGGGVGGECCAAVRGWKGEAGPGQALHGADGAAAGAPDDAQLACRGGEEGWTLGSREERRKKESERESENERARERVREW